MDEYSLIARPFKLIARPFKDFSFMLLKDTSFTPVVYLNVFYACYIFGVYRRLLLNLEFFCCIRISVNDNFLRDYFHVLMFGVIVIIVLIKVSLYTSFEFIFDFIFCIF